MAVFGFLYLAMFQFHIGSIKDQTAGCGDDRDVEFQFHIGSIKELEKSEESKRTRFRFNSTLVQLKKV